jgi:ubiquinone biosynthesis protein
VSPVEPFGAYRERLRTVRVYDTILRYANDVAFDRGRLGRFRRFMQQRLYRPPYPLTPLTTPQRARLLLQELGPTYVKLGQIVSSRSATLPSEWAAELVKLQSDVEPFSYDEVRAQILAELGHPPEELYARFDREPLAAASLGQTHRATLHDGREVVVKVQRPLARRSVPADAKILSRAARALERRQRWARELGLADTITEFGDTLVLELDYRSEAYNSIRLGRNLAPIAGLRLPQMHLGLSGESVLTMEFIDGVKASDVGAIDRAGLDRTAIAERALRAAVKMLLIDGFFHADPHPGNVFVELGTGELVLLDTGMVGEISVLQRIKLVQLLYQGSGHDVIGLGQALRSVCVPFRTGVDDAQYLRDFERRLGLYLDPDTPPTRFGIVMSRGLDVLQQNGLRLDPSLTLAMKALMQAEAFVTVLLPPEQKSQFAARAAAITRELIAEHVTTDVIGDAVKRQAGLVAQELLKRTPSIQQAIPKWLDSFQKGAITVKIDSSDLDAQVKGIARIARAVTLGVTVVGVLVSCAIVLNANVDDDVRDLARVVFIVFVILAVIGAIVIASGLLRDRHRR